MSSRKRPLYERYAEWAQRYGNVFLLHVFRHTIVVLNSLELMREAAIVCIPPAAVTPAAVSPLFS